MDILSIRSPVEVRGIVIGHVPVTKFSVQHRVNASVVSDTPMMNFDASSCKACLKLAISKAGMLFPRIALKSNHASCLPPNLGSATFSRLLHRPFGLLKLASVSLVVPQFRALTLLRLS